MLEGLEGYLEKLARLFLGRRYRCNRCGNEFRGNRNRCPECGHTVFSSAE